MSPSETQKKQLLAAELQTHLNEMLGTQAAKAKKLGISQPRLSDLVRNRLDKFSIDALISLCQKSGLRTDVAAQRVLIAPSKGSVIQYPLASGPFSIDSADLSRLGTIESSKIFLELLRCQTYAAGLSPKDVLLSLNVTKADGGIDAKVSKTPESSGFLEKGVTYFQIKSGSAFKPWQESQLKKELVGKSNARPNVELLGDAVKDCLDNGGRYCLVVFGHDLQPLEHSRSEQLLVSLFAACGYPDVNVAIYGQGQVAGELGRFPSLCLDLIGLQPDPILSIKNWQSQKLMQLPLFLGDEQIEFAEALRKTIFENTASHIRVIGEPGAGKTRLVLEALKIDEIAPTVIYVPTGEEFQSSRLFKDLMRNERHSLVTLVVDDCDNKDRASIWSQLMHNPFVTLITIDHGLGRTTDSGMKVMQCPLLPPKQIEMILREYVPTTQSLYNWADICGGSPRVAHAVGENLANNPDDILKPPATVPLWDRYISGHQRINDATSSQYLTVLRHIALFDRFGFEAPVSSEGRFIAELIQDSDPSISYHKFQEIVEHFRQRRILQGSHTLFIAPRALHIHLWVDYWNNYGREFDFNDFFARLPDSMTDWFLRLFTYAHKSDPAHVVVRSLLDVDGPFADESFAKSQIGPRLLRYLAEADALATLKCISRLYGGLTSAELLAWETGRQDIVWALQCIAVWRKCFDSAARLLTKMALSENARNSNNSRGTLLELFSIGLGWAPTQAPPTQRYPILKGLVTSRDEAEFRLGLELCEQWLSTYGGSRVIGPEHQGLREPIPFWHPETYGDVYDSWRSVLSLLESELDDTNDARVNEIAAVLAKSAEGLIGIANMADEIVDLLFDLSRRPNVNKKNLVAVLIRLIRDPADKIPDEITKKLKELDEILTGTSLWDRIARYVLYSNWDEDLVLDGEEVLESDVPKTRVEALAKEIMAKKAIFREIVPKLMRSQGHRLVHLGLECARNAVDTEFDEDLIGYYVNEHEVVNEEFLSGYLSGIREQDNDRWESLFLSLLDNPVTQRRILSCIRASGPSEEIVKKIAKLYETEAIRATDFGRFSLRPRHNDISADTVCTLLEALAKRPTPGSSSVLLELMDGYFLRKESPIPLPRDLAHMILDVAVTREEKHDPMREYHWGNIAEALLSQYPNDALVVFNKVINAEFFLAHSSGASARVAGSVMREDPEGAWEQMRKQLEGDKSPRFELTYWLHEATIDDGENSRSPASFLPEERVIEWTKKDVKQRAWKAIAILPKSLDPQRGGLITSRFIEEFGDDESIASGLAGHFWAGSWSGPESLYLEKKRDSARRWLRESRSPAVQNWLYRFIESLDQSIERARINEERGF